MSWIDFLGFIALGISLFAMSNKNVVALRRWHLLSSSLYLVYGCAIAAYPIVLGAVLYCGIHGYHLGKNRYLFSKTKGVKP